MSIVEVDGLSAADLQTLSQLPTLKSILGIVKLVAGNFPSGFQAEAITVDQLIEVFKSVIQTPINNLADTAYPTLAEALTHIDDLPSGKLVLITNNGANNGLYLSDGITLVKTDYDAIVLSDVFKDIQTITDVVKLNETTDVTSQYGDVFYTLKKALYEVIQTGGFEPFLTEAALLASVPTVPKKAAKALDTHKIWYWGGSSWTDTGLSELDLAKQYTASFNAITLNKNKDFPLTKVTRGSVTTSYPRPQFSAGILDIKVFGAKKGEVYRIGILNNGDTSIGGAQGIRLESIIESTISSSGAATIIHDRVSPVQLTLDYAKGGIQTCDIIPDSRPEMLFQITFDVDYLNSVYGAVINSVTTLQPGYNYIIAKSQYFNKERTDSQINLINTTLADYSSITVNRDKTYPLQFFARNTTNNSFNAILNKALLSAKVDGATPNNLYKIDILSNGYDYGGDIGVSEGIRIQRIPLNRLADGYALGIHDYATKSIGLDYAKGGIQTVTFACTNAPKTIITLTLDVDILNQTYGTPINLTSSSQVGYNTFIHTNTYSYRDNLIANDKLCGVEYDSVTQMLTFKYKTQNKQYYCVYMKRKAINNTFTIYGWGYADANPPFSDEVYDALSATYTMRTQADSDWISPLVVKAINNIDVGSENRAAFYTSGSHGSDGNAGGSATAEMIMLSIYVDDVKQSLTSSFKKRCDVVRVEVINAVQAYNTVDQSRPVLDQAQTYTLSKNGVYVTQTVKAREAIEITADNACQMYFAGLTSFSALSILMHGGQFTSRQIIQNSSWDTGTLRNIYGAVTRLGAYEFASWVDPEFGIGDRRHVLADDPVYKFPRVNGKLYPRLFSGTVPTAFSANESYTWRGGYYWGATTAQDSIDSVLKVQSGTLILKNDGSYLINK